MGSEEDRPEGALAALALVSQLGLAMVVPILAGVAGGVYLDRWLGGGGLVLAVAVLLGVAGGFLAAYRIVSRYLD